MKGGYWMTPEEFKIWLEEQERGEYKTIGWAQVHGKPKTKKRGKNYAR
jgi:hypothetical protein